MIYEIVDSSDDEQDFSLGYFTDKNEASLQFDGCKEPADFGSPVEDEDEAEFEIREHKEGWRSYYKVIKRVKFISVFNKQKADYVWEKHSNCIID